MEFSQASRTPLSFRIAGHFHKSACVVEDDPLNLATTWKSIGIASGRQSRCSLKVVYVAVRVWWTRQDMS